MSWFPESRRFVKLVKVEKLEGKKPAEGERRHMALSRGVTLSWRFKKLIFTSKLVFRKVQDSERAHLCDDKVDASSDLETEAGK